MAQDSKPADPIAALKPEMTLLMTGGPWTEKAVRPIVATLVEKGLHGAAAWWIALAQEAIAAGKLPRSADAMLKPFVKACEKNGVSPEDKQLAGKIVKAVQAMVASKNFSEAKRWIPLAETLSRVAPDSSLAAAVAKLDSDVAVKTGNQDTTALVAHIRRSSSSSPSRIGRVKERHFFFPPRIPPSDSTARPGSLRRSSTT
jgi:hypothetical protein